MRRHTGDPQDLPDFLEDSPYLPLYEDQYEYDRCHAAPRRPASILQILRSGQTRTRVAWIFKIAILLVLLKTLHGFAVRRWFSGPRCLATTPVTPPASYLSDGEPDWSRYAYAQYVTDAVYLCNSVMIFESLHRLGSRAERVMLYPSTFNLSSPSTTSDLLQKSQDLYGVKLVPIEVQHIRNGYYKWADSHTKLLVFNQTQYERIIVLDSDATLLQHTDELFFIPPAGAAMPWAYWHEQRKLSSHLMVVSPSAARFRRVAQAIASARDGVYDMEIINKVFGGECVVVPHRRYALLTGEFRRTAHERYMGGEAWDADEARREAKLVHFSDHPLEKPWVESPAGAWEAAIPSCEARVDGREDCRARDIWLELYKDFRERRKEVCGLDLQQPS